MRLSCRGLGVATIWLAGASCATSDSPGPGGHGGSGGAGGGAAEGAGPGHGGSADGAAGAGAAGAGAAGAAGGGGSTSSGTSSNTCPAGELASGISADGALTCTSVAELVRDAVEADCTVHIGIRDDCNGCTTAPQKWGRSGGASCANGAGSDNTCSTASLGGKNITLFGLNPDGDVDGNDKLYATLHCKERVEQAHPGPCGAGELAVAIGNDGALTCRAFAPAALDFVRSSCVLYLGWRDACDDCTTAPAKWGEAGSTSCTATGTDTTCSEPSLGGETVQLIGVNPDGDVDGNDKIYIGMRCEDATPDVETAGGCQTGYFMSGYEGNVATCEKVAPAVHDTFVDSCSIYFGWRDSCDGCTTAPAKWGRAGVGSCTNGAGSDNTCSDGPNGIKLFGLNPDGDTDGNDKLYVGMSCQP